LNLTPQTRPVSPSVPAVRLAPHQSLSPFLATDPNNPPITPFLATLPKSLDFKSFPCHTCETPRGGLHKLLTRNLKRPFHLPAVRAGARPEHLSSYFCPDQVRSSTLSTAKPPLSFHTLTSCKFSNSFVLTFMHVMGGVYPPSPKFLFLQRLVLVVSQPLTPAARSPLFAVSLQSSTFNLLPPSTRHSSLLLRITDHGPRPCPSGLRLSSFSSLSTVNCELTTASLARSAPFSSTSHQSPVTSHAS